jgi:enamidase
VWLVGEIGLGGIYRPEDAAPMVEIAHRHGFKVMMHTGGSSIPGSSTVTANDVMRVRPDVVSHLNGGPTAVADVEIHRIIEETDLVVELVQCGNFRSAQLVARLLAERGELHRLILGNDAPSGTGVIPLGMLRNVAYLSSCAGLDPAVAIACATGNTARTYSLPTGVIEPGREADLVVADAPMGSAGGDALEALALGDLPGIGCVLVDGQVKARVSRNTPPPTRKPTMTEPAGRVTG